MTVVPLNAFAEKANQSIWEQRYYVDKLGKPTSNWYISNAEPIIGKFSNRATSNSILGVYLIIQSGSRISIRLIEYGNYIVNNPYSYDTTYETVLIDSEGNKHYLTGTMYSQMQDIYFDDDDSFTIYGALLDVGTVQFSITDEHSNKYFFSVEITQADIDRIEAIVVLAVLDVIAK